MLSIIRQYHFFNGISAAFETELIGDVQESKCDKVENFGLFLIALNCS